MKSFLVLIVCVFGFNSCYHHTFTPYIKTTWGYRYSTSYYINDSNYGFGHSYYNPRRCFPGFQELDSNIFFAETTVVNRWGDILYKSNNMNKNWICNDSLNLNDTLNGGLYYILLVKKKDNIFKFDTIYGAFQFY